MILPQKNNLGVIVYLIKNNRDTLLNLKNSLYFLYNNYLAFYNYDIILFHDEVLSPATQVDILQYVSLDPNVSIRFYKIVLKTPDWINATVMNDSIKSKPVNWWRDEGYRNMCRFYGVELVKYVSNYEYYMRLDCDSFIEEPIADLFQWCKRGSLDYVCHKIQTDCHICNQQLLETTHEYMKSHNINVSLPTVIHNGNTYINAFYNNFHITRIGFWQNNQVSQYIDYLDKTGNMYYYRWGDAPIHTLAIQLFRGKSRIVTFRYSKRGQRGFNIDGSPSFNDCL
jgi:alpha 1,2-mannosyltransferase